MAHQVNGDLGNDWLKTHSAGSGPFTYQWRRNGSPLSAVAPYSGTSTPTPSRATILLTPCFLTSSILSTE